MTKTPPLTVDFTQEDNVLQILPRPPLQSSANLGWSSIYVQQHQQPPWETPEYAHTQHMLIILDVVLSVPVERWIDGRRQQEQLTPDKNVVVLPATVQHRVSWNHEGYFSLLVLEPDYLVQVARESVTTDHIELRPHYAMGDPLINQIGRSLTAELKNNQLHSRLFADSLTTVLSIHLIRHYSNWQKPLREYVDGLSRRQLKQAIEYIDDNLIEDLTVSAIAHELEMSQYYFSRLFKQSVGVSPYQYVMQQRIEQAKYLLRTTPLSVSAIALQVGFSNQNQLTIQFRKFAGTTPSGYRKQL